MKHTKILMLASMMLPLLLSCSHKSKYDAEGCFEATEVIVSAEATGRITNFDIEEGDTLVQGQPVGSIDSVQLWLSKMQLQKNMKSVQSNRPDVETQIQSLKAQISKLQVERNRLARMFKDGAATQKQLDDVDGQMAVLAGQLAAQRSSLRNSVAGIDAQSSGLEMQIAQIDDKLSKCVITSPLQGTVLAKYAEAGEFATMGKPLFKVANLHRMILRAYVTGGQLSKIKLGGQVKVTADFGGNKHYVYPGTIVWIADKSEFTPKSIQTGDERENLVYAVKVSVNNDGMIKLGMYGGVNF